MNDNVPSIPKVDENMLIDLSQDIKVKIYNPFVGKLRLHSS